MKKKFNIVPFYLTSMVFFMSGIDVFAMAPAADGQSQSILVQLLPLALIFVIFFFLVIRPQQKKMKKHREMVSNVKKGDEVVTASGLFGKVSKLHDGSNTILLEIADKTNVKITKESISRIIDSKTVTETKTVEKDKKK